MIKIAITGTIGSGKSFCCNIIKQYGYEVFDCDLQVKKILDDKNVQNEISELLNINFNDGIDYRIIADVVFNDNQLLLSYENIIFNELIVKMKYFLQKFLYYLKRISIFILINHGLW